MIDIEHFIDDIKLYPMEDLRRLSTALSKEIDRRIYISFSNNETNNYNVEL